MTRSVVLGESVKPKRSFLIFLVAIGFIVFGVILLMNSKPLKSVKSSPSFNFQTGNSQEFAEFAKNHGPQKSYELLKQYFSKNDAAAHDFAHVIGIVAYEQGGLDDLKVCDTAYNYGCYHGFIEAFIGQNGVAKVNVIEDGCIKLGVVHAPSCLHGIGHGVMVDASYKLETALANCSILKESSQIYCWDGVFMERIVGSMLSARDKPVMTEETLLEPCNSVEEIYRQQCWRNQVAAWFQFFASDTKKVAGQCSLLASKYQAICFESLGLIVVITYSENTNQIAGACQGPSASQASDDCLIGALKELLFEGKNPDVASNLCNLVSEVKRTYCWQIFSDHLSQSKMRFGR